MDLKLRLSHIKLFFQTSQNIRNLIIITASTLISVIISYFLYNYLYKSQSLLGNNSKILDNNKWQNANKNYPITVKPSKYDAAGMSIDSNLIISTNLKIPLEQLKKSFKFTPEIKFNFTKKSPLSKDYKINFVDKLQKNQIYRADFLPPENFEINQNSWVFQTKKDLKITSTYPNNKATDIPLNAGVEILINYPNISSNEILKNLEIFPKIKGHIEKYQNKYVFIVDKFFQPKTVYSVILHSGLEVSGSEQKLEKDYKFSFETTKLDNDTNSFSINFAKKDYQYPSTEPPVFDVDTYIKDQILEKMNVKVYKFDDMENFIKAISDYSHTPVWARYKDVNFDISQYQANNMLKFSTDLHTQSNTSYISFPEKMAKGFYFVEMTILDKKVSTFLQISDIAGMLATTDTKTLIWGQDLSSKLPIPGLNISLWGSNIKTTTGNEGVAEFETPKEILNQKFPNYYILSKDDNVLVLPTVNNDKSNYFRRDGSSDYQINDDYWGYVYTDRPIYKAGDKLQYWGVVKPRYDVQVQQNYILRRADDLNYAFTSSKKNDILIKVGKDGTFIGEIELEDSELGWQSLDVGYYDKEDKFVKISSKGFSIENYVKPAYEIKSNTDKRAYFAGEMINIYGNAEFFDHTPVVNMNLNIDYSDESSNIVHTNQQGKYQFQMPAVASTYLSYNLANTLRVNISPEKGETTNINVFSNVDIFRSDIYSEVSQDVVANRAKIDIGVYGVDLSKINSNIDTSLDDYQGEAKSNYPINLKRYTYHYQKIEDGEYYDFVNKEVYKTYSYKKILDETSDYDLTTDQNAHVLFEFEIAADKFYELEITTTDSMQREYTHKIYVQSYGDYFDSAYKNYYNLTSQKIIHQNKNKNNYRWRNAKYSLSEDVNVVMQKDFQNMDNPSGQFIFMISSRGLRSYGISNSPTYSFKYQEQYIPNIFINSVYFDGYTFHSSHDLKLNFEEQDRKLDISVTSNKNQYLPGESVNLAIKVINKDQNPVVANVNLSLVDEAIYKMLYSSVSLDILQSLYENVRSGIRHIYMSHLYPLFSSQAEGGGGGDDRSMFQDTAFFSEVKTDKKGEASVDFKLPDNITTWRVNSQAVTTDLFAGSSSTGILVTKPMFVDVVMAKSYLQTDKPIIKIRTYGDGLKAEDDVSLKLSSDTLNFGENANVSVKAFEDIYLPINFSKLGKYKIKFTAKAGNHQDIVTKEFEVIENRLHKYKTSYLEVSKGVVSSIPKSDINPTYLTFSDHTRGRYYADLIDLSHASNSRLNAILAERVATKLLNKYFDKKITENHSDLSPYQIYGGLSVLPGASENLKLSILASVLDVGDIKKTNLKDYFYKIVNNSHFDDKHEYKIKRFYAYVGLATLKESVLLDLNQYLQNFDQLGVDQQLYLGIGYASIGDTQTANSILQQIIKKRGVLKNNVYYLSVEDEDYELTEKVLENVDYSIQTNSLATALSGLVHSPQASRFYEYLKTQTSTHVITELEKAIYLNSMIKFIPGSDVSISYSLNGKENTQNIKTGKQFVLKLLPKQWNTFNITVNSGIVGITSDYLIDSKEFEKADDQIIIQRNYSVNGINTLEFNEKDLIKVTLTYAIDIYNDDSCRQITDILPSGLRYFNASEYNQRPFQVDRQYVKFCLSGDSDTGELIYFAKAITKGNYLSEPVIVQLTRYTQDYALSSPQLISIK